MANSYKRRERRVATACNAGAASCGLRYMACVTAWPRLAAPGILVLLLAGLVGASSASADDHHHRKPPHHPKPPHPPEPPNLIRGSSFEHPHVRRGTSHPFRSIRGWRLAYGPAFELQNQLVGPAPRGKQYAELDSDASTGIFQRVHTRADRNYRLEFCAAGRPGTPPTENVLVVRWQRRLLARIVLDGGHHARVEWHDYRFKVSATGSRTRLQFNDRGISDSVGPLLDAVRLHVDKGHIEEGCAPPKPHPHNS
jgi:hypothetical protein